MIYNLTQDLRRLFSASVNLHNERTAVGETKSWCIAPENFSTVLLRLFFVSVSQFPSLRTAGQQASLNWLFSSSSTHYPEGELVSMHFTAEAAQYWLPWSGSPSPPSVFLYIKESFVNACAWQEERMHGKPFVACLISKNWVAKRKRQE